jgi:hypothetical protein
MWKQCPHCKEYSFDERQLIALDYFSKQPCTSCGKLVRNDGLRQLLWGPALVGAILLGGFITINLPDWLLPLGVLLIGVLGLVVSIIVPKPVKAEYRQVQSASFEPDLNNDKVVCVDGWNKEQLRVIIDGFMAARDPGGPPYEIEVRPQTESCQRLTFAPDIHPSEFAALVNYLQYPIEFGLPEHAITAVGRMTLSAGFDGIPQFLIGQKAVLYTPENDEDYDVVYVQTEAGASYSYSFQDSSWRQVKAARLSADVNRLREGL